MKNFVTLGVLTAIAVSALPAFADHEYREARRNEYRADRQEMKAQRDAAYGDIGGAMRHEERAARDDRRARREAYRSDFNRF